MAVRGLHKTATAERDRDHHSSGDRADLYYRFAQQDRDILTGNPDAILSHIETLCETMIMLSSDNGSTRQGKTLHQLRQAIDDYFASLPPADDLGVVAQDGLKLGDIVG